MKRRREAVATCEDCNKKFESHESAQLHFSSRSHLQQLLAIKNVSLMGVATEVNLGAENLPENCCGTEYTSDDEVPETDDMGLMEDILNYE